MKKCKVAMQNPAKVVYFNSKSENFTQKYLNEISKITILTTEEEIELAKRIKRGDMNARKKLTEANLRLAANIALKIKNPNMSLFDLIQEANVGLMVAIDKYNYKYGYKFSTYATWWIKQAVLKAISEQSGCVKVPVYVQEILGKYSKLKAKIEKETNTSLSVRDMASRMKISAEKLEEYMGAFNQSVSLETPSDTSCDKVLTLAEIIADENANTTVNAEFANLKRDIYQIMGCLKDREKEVIRLRFGLGETAKKTLDEIGKIYGITKECVRQTEIRALRRLKDLCLQNDIYAYCS
ncbi:MAG: RNA polymerase sigma factor RpoD/SigA [Candidatus Gastranaerophilales bacterium]|nr:RNA polymerase sigma factor RpoD/SigA [Candidatus Gastranaerophilales bacterium]